MTNEQLWELKFDYRCGAEDFLKAFADATLEAWERCAARVFQEDAEMAEIDLVRA